MRNDFEHIPQLIAVFPVAFDICCLDATGPLTFSVLNMSPLRYNGDLRGYVLWNGDFSVNLE
jgi:hypothetical protein